MRSPMQLAPELSPVLQLLQLQKFRWALLSVEFSAAILGYFLHYPVADWTLLLALLALHLCSNLVWLRDARLARHSMRLFGITVLFDLIMLTLLLGLSGGASNGFIALLLLPVAMSAVLLPAQAAYLSALLAIALYNLLLQTGIGQVLEPMHEHLHTAPFSQHMSQMGWAFALSALLIAWFISAQAQLVRQKSIQLMLLQQQQGRQEQMLAVATYAANAAHDLATPLQTLGLISEELSEELSDSCNIDNLPAQDPRKHAPAPSLLMDLQSQIKRCQQIVSQLRTNAQQLRLQPHSDQSIWAVSLQAIQLWLVSRPEISLELQQQTDESPCNTHDALAWRSALFNILDNAAEASLAKQEARLQINMNLAQGKFTLQIRDFGPGLPADALQQLGKMPYFSEHGLGLGQFLATVSLERLGAQITRQPASSGGLCTEIHYQADR